MKAVDILLWLGFRDAWNKTLQKDIFSLQHSLVQKKGKGWPQSTKKIKDASLARSAFGLPRSAWTNFCLFIFQTASSSGDPHVHIIKQVKATDEGLYTCIAGNVLGQATASAYLEVNSARSLMSSGAMQPLLFLLLLLLIAQNKLWINRLTMPRHSSTIRSWTNCQFNQLCDPKIDKTKNWRSVFRTKWRGWKKSLGRHNQAYVFM